MAKVMATIFNGCLCWARPTALCARARFAKQLSVTQRQDVRDRKWVVRAQNDRNEEGSSNSSDFEQTFDDLMKRLRQQRNAVFEKDETGLGWGGNVEWGPGGNEDVIDTPESSGPVDDSMEDGAWDFLQARADVEEGGSRSMATMWFEDLSEIWVLTFESKGEEGVYSLKDMSGEDTSDIIIAFEAKEDAERVAGLLQGYLPLTARPCGIAPQELVEFVTESNYNLHVEPRGSLFSPPGISTEQTDFERSMNLREGKFTVLEDDLSDGWDTPS